MKFSNLNSTSFSLFLRKEWIYFSYIYKKKQKIRKNAFKHHQLLKKKKKPTKRNIVRNNHRGGKRGLKRDRRGAKANNNRRTRGMIKTKRHAKGRGRKRDQRVRWKEKKISLITEEREEGIVKNSKLCIRAKSKNVPLESLYRWISTLLDVRLFCAYNHRGGPSAMLKSDGNSPFPVSWREI